MNQFRAFFRVGSVVSRLDPQFFWEVWSLTPNIFASKSLDTKIGTNKLHTMIKQNPVLEISTITISWFSGWFCMWAQAGEGVWVQVQNPLFCFDIRFSTLKRDNRVAETCGTERAKSHLFKTSKKIKIGSLFKKLQKIMCLTFMMKNEKG